MPKITTEEIDQARPILLPEWIRLCNICSNCNKFPRSIDRNFVRIAGNKGFGFTARTPANATGKDLAINGVEAVQKARSNPYDLILMNIQMPELDGLEDTRRIRQRGEREGNGV